MKSMQRQFGKLMTRSADESNVSVLLRDFDQADTLLSKVCPNFSAPNARPNDVSVY